MKIERMNSDFGNSTYMNMIDNYYFEMPTNVVEIKPNRVEGFFGSAVEDERQLLHRLLISTKIDGEERYFVVGDLAEDEVLGNDHISQHHDKTKSNETLMTWLGALAYYYTIHSDEDEENPHIDIEYFQTMLPIWLLKKRKSFSVMQKEMENRFLQEHEVKVHTLGLEKTITINVEDAKCRIESEVARWAIKKTFDLEDNPDAEQFKNYEVILLDIGGGTTDAVRLPEGLSAPINRDHLQSIDDYSYLKHISKFKNEKFPEEFRDLREFDEFIVNNYQRKKFERKNGNTGEILKLTDEVNEMHLEYAEIHLKKVEKLFPQPKDKTYKYVYIGGVSEVLKDSMQQVVEQHYGEDSFNNNHIFYPEGRKINLYALEILSRDYIKKKRQKQQ